MVACAGNVRRPGCVEKQASPWARGHVGAIIALTTCPKLRATEV